MSNKNIYVYKRIRYIVVIPVVSALKLNLIVSIFNECIDPVVSLINRQDGLRFPCTLICRRIDVI